MTLYNSADRDDVMIDWDATLDLMLRFKPGSAAWIQFAKALALLDPAEKREDMPPV